MFAKYCVLRRLAWAPQVNAWRRDCCAVLRGLPRARSLGLLWRTGIAEPNLWRHLGPNPPSPRCRPKSDQIAAGENASVFKTDAVVPKQYFLHLRREETPCKHSQQRVRTRSAS